MTGLWQCILRNGDQVGAKTGSSLVENERPLDNGQQALDELAQDYSNENVAAILGAYLVLWILLISKKCTPDASLRIPMNSATQNDFKPASRYETKPAIDYECGSISTYVN